MRLQSAVNAPDPGSASRRKELTKATVLQTVTELRRADLRPTSQLHARTLVMCGSKDRINLAASRAAAARNRRRRDADSAGAGHVWNKELPSFSTVR